ncbi:class I SAM-dependent methyltransferase [Patescibacteria group bacterium]|nr:class I SAM-dependent methyltransferase [Patescibacteria group bacterium]MBU1890239.1 class I SAM-dependent methyltransferase [Patescibacteria group bacterium]
MSEKTTNLRADNLNYNNYANEVYDDDVRRSIPGYDELHKSIVKVVSKFSQKHKVRNILDLGVGTGFTSKKILKIIPTASLTAVDFSKQMMSGAKKRLSKYHVRYILGDFSKLNFYTDYEIVLSVIAIHHQNDSAKKRLFKKISNSLKTNGIFIFGDLVTYRDKKKAAINYSRHYHHLVKNARNDQALEEWAYHNKFLNLLAPIEDQLVWLKKAGFSSIQVKYEHFNTALIIATK